MICRVCNNNIDINSGSVNVVASAKIGNSVFLYVNSFFRKFITLSFMGKSGAARRIRIFFSIYNQCLAERQIYYLLCSSCMSHNQYLGENNISAEYILSEWYSLLYRDSTCFGRHELINETRFINWKDHIKEISSQNNIGDSFVVLDIGCAEGILGFLLERDGILTYGIDPSEPMIRFAIDELSLPKERYKHGEYCNESYGASSFDVITSYHVIEHAPDPMGFLLNAKKHLKNDGLLFVSTPNSKLSFEWFNIDGNSYNYTPAHLFLLSEDWFEKAIEKIGFHIVWKETFIGEDSDATSKIGEKNCGMNYVLAKNH